MSGDIRILLLADSHLGFDLPIRPRVKRRRRGHDFLANYAAALAPAHHGEVDVVVHAGDVFDRPNVPASVAYQAFEPLRRVADRGVPVLIVPGNHERSRLPHARFVLHRNVHVFDVARTYVIDVRGARIAFAGFPYQRRDVRTQFADLLQRTAWQHASTDLRLLCVHHCVEGATVGPANYTFTNAADVIRIRDVPGGFAAVLSGHIHRHQVLTSDLRKLPVASPVLYPGSIERTALAEIGEPKGFMIVRLDDARLSWEFRELPARPMMIKQLSAAGLSPDQLQRGVRDVIASVPKDAVLTIRIAGALSDAHARTIAAAQLRAFVPAAMNLDVQRTDLLASRGMRARDTAHSSSQPPITSV